MLRFTAELRRVVAPHGSIAIELGDTYAGGVGFNGTDQFSIDKGRGKMVMSGEDIWWCENHESSGNPERCEFNMRQGIGPACRMVSRRLCPPIDQKEE